MLTGTHRLTCWGGGGRRKREDLEGRGDKAAVGSTEGREGLSWSADCMWRSARAC